MSKTNTKALFDAYRMTISAMRSTGDALMAEERAANQEGFRISCDKALVIYHRRPLPNEQFAALNERQRANKKALAYSRAKMIELGREIAGFCMVVDANTTAAERIAEFALEHGTFDHGVASMGHFIFHGACNPAGQHSAELDVIRHALALACRDYSDNLTAGPEVAAIEHVASENLIAWFTDGPGYEEDGEPEWVDGNAGGADRAERWTEFEGVSFGVRECSSGRHVADEDAPGAYALPLRDRGVRDCGFGVSEALPPL
ncbi:hypothetical protein SAMN05444172_1575 [Burkholderia sp. GAS332]|nr:hypothetical protein SAMN05444172_1575 [Burkholderia sp. GAS332]